MTLPPAQRKGSGGMDIRGGSTRGKRVSSSRRTWTSRAARPAALDPTPPSDPFGPQTSPRFGLRPSRWSCRSKRPSCKRAQPGPKTSARQKRKAPEERGSGRKKHANEASWFGRNFARVSSAWSSKRESHKISLALQPEARGGGSHRAIPALIKDCFSLPPASNWMDQRPRVTDNNLGEALSLCRAGPNSHPPGSSIWSTRLRPAWPRFLRENKDAAAEAPPQFCVMTPTALPTIALSLPKKASQSPF